MAASNKLLGPQGFSQGSGRWPAAPLPPIVALVMLMPMRLVLTILLLAMASPLSAQIYKWLDEDGNIIYSDTPHAGAEELPAREVQTLKLPPVPESAAKAKAKPKPMPYQSLMITSPGDGETLRDNAGQVSVSVSLRPALQTRFGHRLELRVDGRPFAQAGTATHFQLQNMDRGAHSLVAVVLDKDGRVFASSPSVSFYLHRQSVQAH